MTPVDQAMNFISFVIYQGYCIYIYLALVFIGGIAILISRLMSDEEEE